MRKKNIVVAGLCVLMGMLASAGGCNVTDGQCWVRGEGGAGSGQGVGGGVIIPGQGGFGDVPPEPQEAGDGEEGDPCNAGQSGKTFTCNGDIVCYKPIPGGTATSGCHYPLKRFVAASSEKLVADLLKKCQSEHPGSVCETDMLTCTDTPAVRYICNGGISCVDDKGQQDGCTVGGAPSDPYSTLADEVYAYDEADGLNHLADLCEVLKHDKYGNNCANGGMCCVPGSATCNKAP
jgi:hypothetical protein